MGKRPTCDTPGCGQPIPKGGEGHPEICPTCLYWMGEVDRARTSAVTYERTRLRKIAERAIVLRKKSETDGAAVIAYEFCAHWHLDELLAAIVEEEECSCCYGCIDLKAKVVKLEAVASAAARLVLVRVVGCLCCNPEACDACPPCPKCETEKALSAL